MQIILKTSCFIDGKFYLPQTELNVKNEIGRGCVEQGYAVAKATTVKETPKIKEQQAPEELAAQGVK